MPALSPASRQRGVLSPRPAPRQEDAVVVVAQEALAAAALNWQERAERLQQANVRLKERVNEAENARRRSLTVVKNVPALPNNHVFTKQLVDENHALRRETRELQRRLMQFEGPGARYRSASKSKTTRRRAAKITNSTPARVEAGTEKSRALEKVAEVQQKEEALAEQNQAETSPARETVDGLARHPLVQELKQHLLNLEVDLERVRQENTLLRGELEQYQTAGEKTRLQDHGKRLAGHLDTDDQVELQSSVASLLQQIKLLEARYQHLEEKARAKAALYQETTTRLEEMSVQLFEAQQQISAQAEQIQLNSDRAALEDDLLQEFHLLRSENMKLNETVATLSSRPFDALSNDLAKKNIWIAQLEDEVRELETDRANLQNECATTRRTSEHLRYRIETLTTETKDLANELCQVKAECEQQTMQMEVAQLQLRFYTSPDDYVLMSAVGKALKEMKKKELKDNHSEDAGRSRKNEASEDKMIFRSRHPTLAIPADASLWNVVEQHAREIGEKPAFICGLTERTLTYEDLHRQAKQVCAGLAANGISKGDVVLLHSINCIEYPMVFLALNRLGAICSPSSPQFTAEELADQIEAAQAVAVISHEKFTKVATQAAAMRGMPKQQVYALKQIEGSSDLQTIDDGFVRTGDIGYIDDDGFVFIVDRLKELIKYKGHQVAPAEIEDVLNSHPRVVDSACVRGHDQLTGEEIPKAFVVVEAGANPLSEEELMAFVAAKVTGYKRVRAVEFVDSIPKSSSGKILRRVLQARENAMMKKARSRL
ncbi:hypothetical protein PHYBOEH_008485 [Phytophthora boehmeriae]|uniref:4-coumarate-CoA ligase n=1 Tax=Phytophthora boehmeriae TaxID=109152 RepID=A0A8T1X9B4_9STRA|nr:hypothetical protein PHYBOEH_008485 [Phytophthora boehmeriae]